MTQYLEQVCSTQASTWLKVYVQFEGLVTAQALSQIPALDFTYACPGQEFSLISPLPT